MNVLLLSGAGVTADELHARGQFDRVWADVTAYQAAFDHVQWDTYAPGWKIPAMLMAASDVLRSRVFRPDVVRVMNFTGVLPALIVHARQGEPHQDAVE